ncbi:hypothetical protein D3C79_848870 [compost metagenome]
MGHSYGWRKRRDGVLVLSLANPNPGVAMKRFTDSLRSSVNHGDWYVALSTALTLPDVCGRLIDPNMKSGPRYAAWFNTWMEPRYSFYSTHIGHVQMLGGDDCYALRCSYLHQGEGDTTGQKASKALESFHFVEPPPDGGKIHCNKINNTLQLQVDIFCTDMADAVDRWADSVAADAGIQLRMKKLLVIHKFNSGVIVL